MHKNAEVISIKEHKKEEKKEKGKEEGKSSSESTIKDNKDGSNKSGESTKKKEDNKSGESSKKKEDNKSSTEATTKEIEIHHGHTQDEIKIKDNVPYIIHYVYAPQLFSDENPNSCSIL